MRDDGPNLVVRQAIPPGRHLPETDFTLGNERIEFPIRMMVGVSRPVQGRSCVLPFGTRPMASSAILLIYALPDTGVCWPEKRPGLSADEYNRSHHEENHSNDHGFLNQAHYCP